MGRSEYGKTTVVVVEDHADTCELLASAVATAGFTVHIPEPGDDVVALVQRLTGPVAVTLDIGASGSGYELAKRLEALRPRPRVIAVTGRDPRDFPDATTLFDAYLLKPCLPHEVADVIAGVLGDGAAPNN